MPWTHPDTIQHGPFFELVLRTPFCASASGFKNRTQPTCARASHTNTLTRQYKCCNGLDLGYKCVRIVMCEHRTYPLLFRAVCFNNAGVASFRRRTTTPTVDALLTHCHEQRNFYGVGLSSKNVAVCVLRLTVKNWLNQTGWDSKTVESAKYGQRCVKLCGTRSGHTVHH